MLCLALMSAKQSMKIGERRRKIIDYNGTLHVEQHIIIFPANFSCNFAVSLIMILLSFIHTRVSSELKIESGGLAGG